MMQNEKGIEDEILKDRQNKAKKKDRAQPGREEF